MINTTRNTEPCHIIQYSQSTSLHEIRTSCELFPVHGCFDALSSITRISVLIAIESKILVLGIKCVCGQLANCGD